MTRFISLTLLFSFFTFINFAIGQDGPCLHIRQNSGESTLSAATCPVGGKHSNAVSNQYLVEFRHPDRTASVDDPNGWLKAFWIFGDGNFLAFPDTDKATEMATLDQDYTYHLPGNYLVVPVMIEKKTNQEPPGSDYRPIRIDPPTSPDEVERRKRALAPAQQVAGPAGTAFRREITTPDRADIYSSSLIRLGGYQTVFAVSAPMPVSEKSKGVILFFYNSVQVADNTSFSALDLFRDPNVESYHANYDLSPDKYIFPTSQLPSALNNGGRASGIFGKVLVQPMNVNFGAIPASFNEYRFFPSLTTPAVSGDSYNTGDDTLNETGRGESQFVALVLQNAVVNLPSPGEPLSFSPGNGPVDSLTENERLRILEVIRTYMPWLESAVDTTTLRVSGTEYYIRGAYREVQSIRTVIDPTQLVVNRICPDDNDPNKYNVEMTATVCNEGNATEPKVTVDLVKGIGMVINDLNYDPNQFTKTLTLTDPNSALKFTYEKNGGLKGAYENPQNEYISSCFDVNFTFSTDWNGAKLLQKGEGLTAVVNFSLAKVKATQSFPNLPFAEAEMTQKTGYACKPEESCWWLWIVLFGLFIAFWWAWKSQHNVQS